MSGLGGARAGQRGFSWLWWGLVLALPGVVAPSRARAEDAPVAREAPAATAPSAPPAGDAPAPAPAPEKPSADAWCAAELETLAGDVCYAKGPASADGRRTLVIFLHGLTDVGSGWQRTLMKGMAAQGKRLHFDLIAPKGRTGVGPGKKESQIAWPTSSAGQDKVESEVIEEWLAAKRTLEARDGAYDEVFVMGFSNGAYYASSLALRGRIPVDGFAVFAGGSAPKGSEARAKAVKARAPIFVGISSKDDTTAKKAKELSKALDALKWPHKTSSKPVGHVVADGQLEAALAYLRKEKAAVRAPASAKADKAAHAHPAKSKKAKKGKAQKSASRKQKPTP